jgi:hypothetical protein
MTERVEHESYGQVSNVIGNHVWSVSDCDVSLSAFVQIHFVETDVVCSHDFQAGKCVDELRINPDFAVARYPSDGVRSVVPRKPLGSPPPTTCIS